MGSIINILYRTFCLRNNGCIRAIYACKCSSLFLYGIIIPTVSRGSQSSGSHQPPYSSPFHLSFNLNFCSVSSNDGNGRSIGSSEVATVRSISVWHIFFLLLSSSSSSLLYTASIYFSYLVFPKSLSYASTLALDINRLRLFTSVTSTFFKLSSYAAFVTNNTCPTSRPDGSGMEFLIAITSAVTPCNSPILLKVSP